MFLKTYNLKINKLYLQFLFNFNKNNEMENK